MLLATALLLFFFNDTATTEIYTLSLHDALPILELPAESTVMVWAKVTVWAAPVCRSEEHASLLQAHLKLVWRLLLEELMFCWLSPLVLSKKATKAPTFTVNQPLTTRGPITVTVF